MGATKEQRRNNFYKNIYKEITKNILFDWLKSSNPERGILRRLDYAFGITQDYDKTMLQVDENANGLINIIKKNLSAKPTEEMTYIKDEIIKRCLKIKELILLYLIADYDNYNNSSYDFLNEVFASKDDPTDTLVTTLKVYTKSYRMRVPYDDKWTNKDFFHIPFDKRYLTGSYRYSIPGYPSLYTSSSTYATWEELNRPIIKNTSCICLRAKEGIKLLDFRISTNLTDPEEIKKYLLRLPLIIASSLHVKESNEKFIPEYIFSQQIFKWLMSKLRQDMDSKKPKPIWGVTYTSSKDNIWDAYVNNDIEAEHITNYAFLAYLPLKGPSIKYSEELGKKFMCKSPLRMDGFESAKLSDFDKLEKFSSQLINQQGWSKMSTAIKHQ